MFIWLRILLLFLFLITACSKDEINLIEIEKGPHLFIDNYLIEEESFLTRTINNPVKHPSPILYSGLDKDQIWQPYLSVIKDEQRNVFRMWYNVPVEDLNTMRCRIGYIESADGINWKRPHKILDYPHEVQFGVSVIDRGTDYLNLDERFVLATFLKPGLRISTSPDGLNWNSISDKPVLLHNHDISTFHWDSIREQYFAVVSHRITGFGDKDSPYYDHRRRIPHQSISKDLYDWEDIWPIIQPRIGAPIEEGETQFYSMSGVITRGDLMIGLVKILRDDLNATYGKNANEMGDKNRKAAGIGYTVLAWTRDGIKWHRDHVPFLDRNKVPGTFDHAMAWGDEQIVIGGELFIYYGGYERGHKIERFKERHLGFAKMPIDRYVSRDADFNGGSLLTKPLSIRGDKITLNANVVGECKIRVVDYDGELITGAHCALDQR